MRLLSSANATPTTRSKPKNAGSNSCSMKTKAARRIVGPPSERCSRNSRGRERTQPDAGQYKRPCRKNYFFSGRWKAANPHPLEFGALWRAHCRELLQPGHVEIAPELAIGEVIALAAWRWFP